MQATARVAWQDVPFAKAPIWVVCGPIAPLTPEVAARTLNNMASHGPETRVGLIPTAGTRRWKFDERPGDTAIDADFTFDSEDITEMLTQLMQTSPKVPIWIATQGGDYFCMCVDHGIGDANIVIELVTAMSQAGKYADFVPPLPGAMRTPLLSCFWNAAKGDPKGMWSEALAMVKSIVTRKRVNNDISEEAGIQSRVIRTQSELPTAVFVKSRLGYANELREYRARTQQTVSVTTLVARSLYHAFRDVGINLADDILVTMDLRRFLSPNRWSLANLSSAVSVPVTPEMSAEEFTAAVFWQVTSRKPLLGLMATAFAARIKGLPAEMDVARSQNQGLPAEGPLTLSISDVSKIPAVDKVSWKPGSDISEINVAVALPAAYPSYLSIALLSLPDDRAVHLTATFFSSRVDPELVREGLKKTLETPGSPCAE